MGISYTERRTPMENSVWGDAPRGMLDTTPNTPEQLQYAAKAAYSSQARGGWDDTHLEIVLAMMGLEVQP